MLGVAALVSSVALLLSGAAGVQVAQTSQPPVLTLSVTGRGWGHGIGMSQWGAYGFAQRGATYEEILAHYYPGTELSRTGGTSMRVLIVESVATVSVGSDSAFTLRDASGTIRELEPGRYTLGRALKIGEETFTPPLRLAPKGSPLVVNGARYRGTVTVSVEKRKLSAVNTVGLEAYLRGVVPREVPRTWPAEALKAQAVAARSYALATRKPSGPFDAYADVRSQVYGGLDGEASETTAAVQATARQVLLYEGKVATTYFFSTSGGKTVDISEAWGSPPVPYLVSVEDPYDDASPHHTWGPVAVGSKQLRSALKLRSAPVDARVKLGPSGRATQLVLTLADGGEVAVAAGTVRSALGLRSTWFRIGLLSLQPPAKSPVTFGTRARLGGFARGVGSVALERKPAGAAWEKVTDLVVAADGSFVLPFRGERTTDYRLATAKLKAAPLRVAVAPNVKLKAGASPGTLQGTVRPVFPGATVVVQRQEGSRWITAGTAVVDDAGAFEATLELAPGSYRARLAPRPGYAVGLSRTLSVSS
ncbi:MAG: SpoIID/LytB domain-containing protein [Gaiellaceae bacterium]